jgi:GNAT superfamily N-acetyltransferase
MVPGERFPLNVVRRPLAAFAVTALLVWWLARRDGVFYLIGVDGWWSELMGPALPALCAGATVALALSLLEAASGRIAGIIGAVGVVMLPSFMPMHRASLHGPPLLALTMFMLAVMIHAPRFSFAYGGAAAVAAVFVSPAAAGLPIAAASWAMMHAHRRGKRPGRRVVLALAPLALAVAVAQLTGTGAWAVGGAPGWRGGFDAAAAAAGTVIGDQLAPGIGVGGLRWFIIADATLVVIALLAVAWRREVMPMPSSATPRRMFEAGGLVVATYAAGMTARTMLDTEAQNPGLREVFPLAVVALVLFALAVALRWPRWSRAGKLAILMLGVGWRGGGGGGGPPPRGSRPYLNRGRMATIAIRTATVDDVALIHRLIRALASYERLAHECVATEDGLRRSLFGDQPGAEVLIAEFGGVPAGFALYFHNYSTFLARRGIWLEDLFVDPEFRGHGIGRMLLARLAVIALERDCGRLEWWVLDWNESAIGFYRSLGAQPMDEWTVFRMTGDALVSLADQGKEVA